MIEDQSCSSSLEITIMCYTAKNPKNLLRFEQTHDATKNIMPFKLASPNRKQSNSSAPTTQLSDIWPQEMVSPSISFSYKKALRLWLHHHVATQPPRHSSSPVLQTLTPPSSLLPSHRSDRGLSCKDYREKINGWRWCFLTGSTYGDDGALFSGSGAGDRYRQHPRLSRFMVGNEAGNAGLLSVVLRPCCSSTHSFALSLS